MQTPRLLSVLTLLLVATGCSQPDTAGADQPSQETRVTPIRLTVAGQPIAAQLADNPTANDLLGRLPMTLSFRDLNQLEKIAKLPRPLTTDGVPDGADPQVADIGYYAPSRDLVLYYGDVGYYRGIVRIGRFDSSQTGFIASQADGFEVAVRRG